MELISKFNRGIQFLLWVIDDSSKYAWISALNDKKDFTITNGFQQALDRSNHEPNKIWVDKGSEFYNKLMKSWLQ